MSRNFSRRDLGSIWAAACAAALSTAPASVAEPGPPTPQAAARLLAAAYPDAIAASDGATLVWRDGTRMTIGSEVRRQRTPAALLASPDPADIFAHPYPVGVPLAAPPEGSDPGRIRPEALFRKLYGDCRKGEVVRHLVDVVWLPAKWGKTLKVTRLNGVAEKLAAVSAELDRLPSRFDPFLRPAAGGYNCRPIAGEDRTSPHGLGIAVDLATAPAHYWRWTRPDKDGRRPWRNAFPREIVEIFERHGFIWGGAWHHYDTMHFEYRPELIAAARCRESGC